jgi:hypothetical protein
LAGRYTDNIVVKNRYFRVSAAKNGGKKATGQKLSNHFKYLEHRPKEKLEETREDRHLFNAESDHVSRKDATSDVMEHTSNRAAYHHLVLSPDPQEPISDLRQWTRDIMSDFEHAQGKEIHWYAVQHYNTDHPHVHVVIAGAGEGQDKLEPVTIYPKDLDQFHASALEHSDHQLYQHMNDMHTHDMQELAAIQQQEHAQEGIER